MTLPFTFAWVTENDRTFDPDTMNVFDEEILAFDIKHEEGQVPVLNLKIRNPRIGLISPGRNVWGWFAWQNEGHLIPLFFGVLVGTPTSLFQEVVTIQLIARSPTYISDKQDVAETMKVAPYYDPVWFDLARRDDPDSILEGWSALWHIDRTTLETSASDILVGEDGTVTFTEDDALYSSVSLELGQPPLSNLRVEATVNWTQRTSGFIIVPELAMSSYTGETLLSGWPKPGGSLGGGYKVVHSFVTDIYNVSQTPDTSYNSNWTNSDPNPGQCGNASASSASSGPALLSPNPIVTILTGEFKSGICFPDSDPPTNTPATTKITGMIVPLWSLSMKMTVRYDANRSFSEVLAFNMIADTQSILTAPTVSQNTELLTLSSVDIGQPLLEVDAWTDFRGQSVSLAQIIFPNNPTKPGGLSFQICVAAGIAGDQEPTFSDFPGVTTTDGTVIWSSMGKSPLTDNPDWSPASFVPVGQIINFQKVEFNADDGDFETVPGQTSYYICTGAGRTNDQYTILIYTPTKTSNVEATPSERRISYIKPPLFSGAPGAHVSDGSVTWTVLGKDPAMLQIPVGGSDHDVRARSFFPTLRGQRSIEFLISKARARLRMRARAIKIGWDAAFEMGIGLSCRKNATLFDPRLPGSAATGKIVSYTLSGAGDGKLRTHVEIGCAIGFGNSITEITGDPEYAAPGYMQHGYQRYDGAYVAHGSGDTTYTVPANTAFDDGLSFPLHWSDISDKGIISGKLDEQRAKIITSFDTIRLLTYLQAWAQHDSVSTGLNTTTQSGLTPDQAWKLEREQIALATQSTPYVMQANPISWACLIKPCAGNGPFEGAYTIDVTPLVVPQGINLEAPSSP
jgi:hypothetical protein